MISDIQRTTNMLQCVLLQLLILQIALPLAFGRQSWTEEPSYIEVNPEGTVILPCLVAGKKGECRWEKDSSPIGIFPTKYEWAGAPGTGDCSLRVLNSSIEFDDGIWQCQVTASSFSARDALISQGAQLVVRESPNSIIIQRIGNIESEIIASAGEDVELECISTGGNPPAQVKWFLDDQEIAFGHAQDNRKSSKESRTWISVSKLTLPVNKEDNGAQLVCMAEHPALDKPIQAKTKMTIHYPPNVKVQTTSLEYLEDQKDPVTLTCQVDSNPSSTVLWRKEGLDGIFSGEKEIVFSPVTRQTAGVYICTAENTLGLSKPALVEIDVKYSPRILSVGPAPTVIASMYNKTLLTCEAEGNPPPRYQWLQKLPTQEVLIRGYNKQLLIDNVTYDHQGEFVCKAVNKIRGESRAVQSQPIRVEVKGAPKVNSIISEREITVQNGEDAVLEVHFCADPLPKQSWHLGDMGSGSGNNIILAAGTGHGRFIAEKEQKSTKEDCYISILKVNGAHSADSAPYELRISNDHGSDSHIIHLSVRDHVSQESLIAVIVGCILTLLLLILIIIYAVKADKCCCGRGKDKKNFKQQSDLESEKTDVESTHSSNLSGHPDKSVIPPDALYVSTSEKNHHQHVNPSNPHHPSSQNHHHKYIYNHDTSLFNDSKHS
uniref:Ig-like domain-containing protein n=2 Tax=Lepeophtheirus salmonis TaxID=72036 RepID=A0A0K2V225_LEPSM